MVRAFARRFTRPRQPFVLVTLAACVGIVAAEPLALPLPALLVPAGWLAIILCLRPRVSGVIALTALVFAALHTLRCHHDPARRLALALGPGPRVIEATGIVLDEPTLPTFPDPDCSCFFTIRLEHADLPAFIPGVKMNVAWSGPMPQYGDRVRLRGTLRPPAETRNPGQFDLASYLHRRGIWAEIEVRFRGDGRILGGGHGSAVRAFAFRARRWIAAAIERDLGGSPEISSLIQSMVLGLRGETPAEAQELFRRTGTLHLFAVSGLNVAMLAGILLLLLRCLRVTGAAAIAVILPALWFYAIITGLPASCVRATLMGSLVLVAPVFDRRAIPTNSIFAAAFLILAWDTQQLFSPGFQLSFVLALTIVLLTRPIEHRILPLAAPDPFLPRALWSPALAALQACWQLLVTTIAVTLAAWVGSLLFSAGYFHLFSVSSILANFCAVPLAFGILAVGLCTIATAGWAAPAATLFNHANWLLAQWLLAIVGYFAHAPAGHQYVEWPSVKPAPLAELTVLDVRTGAATHLRTGGGDWLLDCGSAAAFEQTVLPYLRSRGVDTLQGLLISHGDSQHLGGAIAALTDLRPRHIYDSPLTDRSPGRSALHRQLAASHRGKALIRRGDRLTLGPQVHARILFPPPGLQRTRADDKALVIQLTAAGRRILLMSDAGFVTEQWLVENDADLRSDLLIKGQHVRDTSGSDPFLSRVQPLAIICTPRGRYQEAAVLDTWEADTVSRGIAVFRQDRAGAARITISRAGDLEVRAFRGNQTLRSRAR